MGAPVDRTVKLRTLHQPRGPTPGPSVDPGRESETIALLRRAAVLRALAWSFAYPRPGHRTALLAALEGWDTEPLSALEAAWRAVDEDQARTAYSRLFFGNAPCPLNEVSWCSARDLSGGATELADIQGFYRAFGFELADCGRERADHLSTELEFLAAMLVKAAYARFQGWEEAYRVTYSALARFLEAHPGRWMGALSAHLSALEAEPPYQQAAATLGTVIRGECEAFDVHPATVDRLPRASVEPDAFTCPFSPACGHAPDPQRGEAELADRT
jgi:TorA maturation chaperone TorD